MAGWGQEEDRGMKHFWQRTQHKQRWETLSCVVRAAEDEDGAAVSLGSGRGSGVLPEWVNRGIRFASQAWYTGHLKGTGLFPGFS